jgi:hypothetical protein
MTTVEADGVRLGVEHFGDASAPLCLLAGGTTMLSWPNALCEALAHGGRHVVRYDLRDSGASTTVDPEAPAYTLRDLAADAAALARALDDRPAHLAGAGTRPVAPGPTDDDLAGHDAATMGRLFSRPMPDWSDRAAAAELAAAGAAILGDDPAAAHATAGRIWDRTPGTDPALHMANQIDAPELIRAGSRPTSAPRHRRDRRARPGRQRSPRGSMHLPRGRRGSSRTARRRRRPR